MSAKTVNLHRARVADNDEFYTRYATVENELQHYWGELRHKHLYCNCDDANSNFLKYLRGNEDNIGYYSVASSYLGADGITGDFRGNAAVEWLENCDVVITNPPFSLFQQHFTLTMKHKKEFLVMANFLGLKLDVVFPYIMSNQVFIGYNSGSFKFDCPDDKVKSSYCCWLTNLKDPRADKPFYSGAKYDDRDYPQLDNYAAINVNRVRDIPDDYNGVMAVPINFMAHYCSKQYRVLGKTHSKKFNGGLVVGKDINAYLGGKGIFVRMLIQRIL